MTKRPWSKIVLGFWLWTALTPAATPKDPVRTTQANVMVEVSFTAARAHGDSFNEVTLDIIFQDPTGRDLRIPAFWAGADQWKVRYASPIVGTHRFRSQC